jgi:hypothetical protein
MNADLLSLKLKELNGCNIEQEKQRILKEIKIIQTNIKPSINYPNRFMYD